MLSGVWKLTGTLVGGFLYRILDFRNVVGKEEKMVYISLQRQIGCRCISKNHFLRHFMI